MKVLHVINKQKGDGIGLEHLTKSDTEKDVWFSGYWDIPLAEAELLVGGILYLHESKAKPSRFGGRVLGFEPTIRSDLAHSHRIRFKILAFPEVRGVKWRGADHAMASYGTIIEVDE
ncbi:MAG: hypothetical protein V4586_15460 [Pseudomonadota bacterium]